MFFGVPTQLGRSGVKKIIEYDLNEAEMAMLQRSAESVAANIAKLKI